MQGDGKGRSFAHRVLLCSAGKDHSSGQAEPIEMNLDDCLEYIADDELVEVTFFSP